MMSSSMMSRQLACPAAPSVSRQLSRETICTRRFGLAFVVPNKVWLPAVCSH